MAGDRAPAVGEAVAWLAITDSVRERLLGVEPHERLTVGVVALNRLVDVIESIVVAALAVLRLVVDGRALNLDLTG